MKHLLSFIFAVVLWAVFVVYFGTLPFYYPMILVHLLLFCVFFALLDAIFSYQDFGGSQTPSIPITVGAIAMVAIFLSVASGPFRVGTLRELGGVELSKEQMEVADVSHIRLIPAETAIWKAKQKLGTGKLGSMFKIERAELQRMGKNYYYLCPLQFKDFWKWSASGYVSPGYAKVSAENLHEDVVLVTGYKMRYTYGAAFGAKPSRKMFFSGMAGYFLYETTFEADELGKPFLIMKYTRPTVSFGGGKLRKIVILDVESGSSKTYSFGTDKLPEWVDRAFPAGLAIEYSQYWGSYVRGIWNASFGQKDVQHVVTVPVPGKDLDKEKQESSTEYKHAILVNNSLTASPIWFVGMTSPSTADNSMTGYVAADSMTGKMTFYEVSGFGNERNAIQGVMGKQEIAMTKNYHAADPIFYRIYGVETWIVPVLTPYHLVEMIAIAYGPDPSQVVVGSSKEEALEKYQMLLSSLRNPDFTPTQVRRADQFSGTVSRLNVIGGTSYFMLTNTPNRVFYIAYNGTYPELFVTKLGDKVTLRGGETQEGMVAVSWFDNLNLELSVSVPQEANLQQYEKQRQEKTAASAEEVKKKEEELKQLKEQSQVVE